MTARKLNEPVTISLNDMNNYIIRSLLGTVYPVESSSLKTHSIGMEFFELQRFLCSNPNLKIIEIYNINGNEALTSANSRTLPHQQQQARQNPLLKSLISTIPKYHKNSSEQFVKLTIYLHFIF